MNCSGPCDQGRARCPTPDACEAPDDGSMEMLGVLSVYVVGIAFGAVSAAIIIWLFFL